MRTTTATTTTTTTSKTLDNTSTLSDIDNSMNVKNEVNCNDANSKPPAIPARRSLLVSQQPPLPPPPPPPPLPMPLYQSTQEPASSSSTLLQANTKSDLQSQSQSQHQHQQQEQQALSMTQLRCPTSTSTSTLAKTTSTVTMLNVDSSQNATLQAHNAVVENFNKLLQNTQHHQHQHQQPQQQQQQAKNYQINIHSNIGCNANTNSSSNNLRKNVWPRDKLEQDFKLQTDGNQFDGEMFENDNETPLTTTPTNKTAAFPTTRVGGNNIAVDDVGINGIPMPAVATAAILKQHNSHANNYGGSGDIVVVSTDNEVNVEAVVLQNQVDTLQWQLKQVETSREMYRAVMEEVARFLDRFNNIKLQRQLQQSHENIDQQIIRPKSFYSEILMNSTMSAGDENTATPPTCSRARSITNLAVDLKAATGKATTMKNNNNNNNKKQIETEAMSANAYSAFKDYTWRRSPKKSNKKKSPIDEAEEKLNQEAFRLSRTIQNLLNITTRQPDLIQHRNSFNLNRLNHNNHNNHNNKNKIKTPSATVMTSRQHMPLHNSAGISINATTGGNINNSNNTTDGTTVNNNGNSTLTTPVAISKTIGNKNDNTVSNVANNATNTTTTVGNAIGNDMIFLRSTNMRDSRLSLRSSTDSSVHSTISSAASSASSKIETDEEHLSFQTPSTLMMMPTKLQPQQGSTTEDESGFSSINSFQDIGVPMCSTMVSQVTSTPMKPKRNHETSSLNEFTNDLFDSRNNSTLKTSTITTTIPPSSLPIMSSTHPNNIVGVPLNEAPDMQHRWDMPTALVYRNVNHNHNHNPNHNHHHHTSNSLQRYSTLSNEDTNAVLWV